MKADKKHIVICSTSFSRYDRRLQRISKSLGGSYRVSWISRDSSGNQVFDWVNQRYINPWFSGGFLFYAVFNLKLFFKLLFSELDLICAVDLDTVLPCYLVSKIRSKPIVFDAHEYFTEVPELVNRKRVKAVWQWIANITLPNISKNYTVGPSLAKLFGEQYGQDYALIKNVPEANFGMNAERESDGKTIVYLGAVNKGRGLEVVISSLPKLKDKKLLILGEGDIEEELKDLAKELQVLDRIEFLGFIDPKNLVNKMKNAWIAVNMLDPISKSYYYSLANKYFDYIHLGIPAVHMDFPEYKKLHSEFEIGILVEKYSSTSLIGAVESLTQPAIYAELSLNTINAANHYTWENEELKLLKLYKKWIVS